MLDNIDNPNFSWVESKVILGRHRQLPIKQVYCWMYTSDAKLIIVTKGSENWQLPGGKPKHREKSVDTLIREIREETGIDISDQQSDLKFFGYNIVTSNAAKVQDRFLQLRYILLHKQESADLSLHTGSEDKHQTYPDQIKFVKAVDLSIALTMIPWLNNSNELSSFYKFIQSNI